MKITPQFHTPRHPCMAYVCTLLVSCVLAMAEPPSARPNAALKETAVVTGALAAAEVGDFPTLGSLLGSKSELRSDEAPSVVLARRSAILCGWLQNQNKHRAAQKVATWSVKRLAHLSEPDESSRLERLYWEALLLGRYLDEKAQALPLLAAAAKIDPNDERIPALQSDLSRAVAQFGR
jgi:hypothetical protein